MKSLFCAAIPALSFMLAACAGRGASPRAEEPTVVQVGSESHGSIASTPIARAQPMHGCSRTDVSGYLEEMRGFMRDPDADSNTSAAKALALLGEREAVAFLQQISGRGFDAFSLAALVLLGDTDARRDALSRAPSLDESDFTMIAYGFERSPDATITARTKQIATTSQNPSEVQYAKALLASMGVGYGDEVAKTMSAGSASRDAVFAARSLMRSHGDEARKVLEGVLADPHTDSLDLAGSAFGMFPEAAPIELLVGARKNAQSPYDKIWVDFALVAGCRR